jgi:hypothetical protein
VLDAPYVALVSVFIGGLDGDNTLRARHFELKVGVVGNHHEFGVAGTPKDGVVGPVEPNYLESEGLLPEVGGGAKADGQVDPPNKLFSFPRHNSMKAPDAGSEVRPPDSQEVKGLGVDNVEAAATVHEHFTKARVGDDGIDNKWVDYRIWDVVRMVVMIESDGRLGPVEEEGGCQLYGEDLSTVSLALARGETHRRSLVYHEAVMDLGKPLVLVIILLLGVLLLVVLLDA